MRSIQPPHCSVVYLSPRGILQMGVCVCVFICVRAGVHIARERRKVVHVCCIVDSHCWGFSTDSPLLYWCVCVCVEWSQTYPPHILLFRRKNVPSGFSKLRARHSLYEGEGVRATSASAKMYSISSNVMCCRHVYSSSYVIISDLVAMSSGEECRPQHYSCSDQLG